MTRFTRFSAAALGAAALMLSASAVSAQSTSVQWDDLDVTTTAGAAELDARIASTARIACRGVRATGSNMGQTAFCRSQIKESVMNSMTEETREAYVRASAQARAEARANRSRR